MYRYLTVSKTARERVVFPDGTETVVEPSEGAAAAAGWQARSQGPDSEAPVFDEAKYAADLADWDAELSRRMDASPVFSITYLREIREAFEAERPRPERPDGLTDPPHPQPTVERVPWWVATGPAEGGATPLGPGSEPFPRGQLAERLSELGRDGWQVVHVSEERVVEYDESAARATIVGASVLLLQRNAT